MPDREIKLENLFQSASAGFRWFLARRIAIYKVAGVIAVVGGIIGASAAVYSWQKSKPVEAAWYNSAWTKRMRLEISPTNVDATLTDFPVLASTTDASLKIHALSDGSDIIFTDASGTFLQREIEYYNADAGSVLAWVKVPTISSTTPTVLYMYYGSSSSVPDSTGTWDSNFKGVWHLPDGTTLSAVDSTSNDNDGTVTNAVAGAGKVDGAADLDGTNDYITLADEIDNAGTLTVSAWARLDAFTATYGSCIYCASYMNYGAGGEAGYGLFFNGDGTVVRFKQYGTAANYTAEETGLTVGQMYHLTGVMDTTSIKLYLNGVMVDSQTLTMADANQADFVHYIGTDGRFNYQDYNGIIDEVRISSSVRSASWIKAEYYNQSSPSTFITFGAEESGGTDIPKPVAYWSFDEGYASTTYDRIGNNDGTLANNTQWVEGKWGKALSFDGVNDAVSMGNVLEIDSGPITLMAWIKPTRATNFIFGRPRSNSNYGNYSLMMASQNLKFSYLNITCNGEQQYQSTDSIPLNTWSQVALTYTFASASSMQMYRDGKTITGSWTGGAGGVLPCTDTTNRLISVGSFPGVPDGTDDSYHFSGLIDEVKIFNVALTESQVKADYNAAGGASGASVGFGGAYAAKTGDPGVVTDGLTAYWKFDEGNWSGADNEIKDYSGLGRHASSTNATSTADQAKFGKSAGFDGSGDWLRATSTAVQAGNEISIAFWAYQRSSTASSIVSFSDANGRVANVHLLYNNGTTYWDAGVDSSGNYDRTSKANPSVTNQWHHWVFWKNAAAGEMRIYMDGELWHRDTSKYRTITAPTAAGYIGYYPSTGQSWDGYIDDVKIFNRALSDNEIMREYVSGPGPVGHWSFEENTGTTAYDVSGNFNNGTLYPGTSGLNSATSTMWAVGKVGGALNFDGTDDYISVTDSNVLDITGNVTVSTWVRANTTIGNQTIVSKPSGSTWASPYAYYMLRTSSNKFQFGAVSWASSAVTSAATFATSTWYHVTGVYNGANDMLYINGTYDNANAKTGAIPASTYNLAIGSHGTGSNVGEYFNGQIDEIKLYNYARTSRQIALDYNGGAPVGYWSFDEGYASTTMDKSGNGYNASLMDNTLWTMNGKFGKAVSFDGTNDYVSFGDNFDPDDRSWTYSFWLKYTQSTRFDFKKRTGSSSEDQYGIILSFNQGAGSAHQFRIGNEILNWTHPFNDNSWHLVTLVRNTDRSELSAYVDSRHIASASVTIGNVQNAANFILGDTSTFYSGTIDDFKIYSYARTPEEIRQDYNAGGSASGRGAGLKLGTERNSDSTWDDGGFGGNAPVAHWRFEENSGTVAYDSTGNLNNGTLYPGTAGLVQATSSMWVTGKVGGALQFDGTDDYVSETSLSTSLSGDMSVVFWFKSPDTPTGQERIVDVAQAANYGLQVCINSSSDILLDNSGGPSSTLTAAGTYANNQWHHVVATRSGTTYGLYVDGVSAGTQAGSALTYTRLFLGGRQGVDSKFEGRIDDVKVYNYARSAAQVAFDYNGGKPVGHWKFDEGTGSTAYDASGKGNNGTITIGASGTNDAVADAWANGVSGKINYALDFDGTDDYVSVGDSDVLDFGTGDFTVGFWVNMDTLTGSFYATAVSKYWSNNGYWLFFNESTKKFSCYTEAGSYPGSSAESIAVFETGSWYHVACTRSGTEGKIYVNGKLDNTGTLKSGSVSSSGALSIGTYQNDQTGNYTLDGKIDDVRIYNYVRNAEQMRQDYNNGAGVRF